VEDVDVHSQALPGEQALKVAEIHRKSFVIALAVLWLAVVSCIVLDSYKAQGWMTGFAFKPRKVRSKKQAVRVSRASAKSEG
jgi:hypothetical protein